MKRLTDRQREAVKIIYEGQKSGRIPTLSELAEKLGVSSKQTAKDLLDAIVKKGYLEREPKRARAIMLKQIAINEIEKEENFFGKIQMNLDFIFPKTTNFFQCDNYSNIIKENFNLETNFINCNGTF